MHLSLGLMQLTPTLFFHTTTQYSLVLLSGSLKTFIEVLWWDLSSLLKLEVTFKKDLVSSSIKGQTLINDYALLRFIKVHPYFQ